jgi:L-lactate utilization protein LutC
VTVTEKTELFLKNLRSIGVDAVHAADRATLQARVEELSADCRSVYCPRATEVEIALNFKPDAIPAHYEEADITIEEMPAAIAETGTIVSWSANGMIVPANLLPPRHLALVSTAHIFADLNEFFASFGGSVPSNITLITGPSRTADIEQILITGVHGPRRVDVVVFDGQSPLGRRALSGERTPLMYRLCVI